jgi:hypothetical protein
MPLQCGDAPRPRSRTAITVAALLLLGTVTTSVAGLAGWCAVAKEPVILGQCFVVGPGCDPRNKLIYVGGLGPYPEAWVVGKLAIVGDRLGAAGPLLLCRTTSIKAWPAPSPPPWPPMPMSAR